ncbi:hypothetical protein ACT3RN_00740 [Psychrobacter sp. AOP5-GZ1-6]|uniref:hypothetical protein n=1 Tax=Psychrobacter sp. AOP5-GZ1-6 TaxID=3457649 RepID=UPI00402B4385
MSIKKAQKQIYKEIGKITATDWPPIQNDYHEKLGYVACDTTDWQNSAIDRIEQ